MFTTFVDLQRDQFIHTFATVIIYSFFSSFLSLKQHGWTFFSRVAEVLNFSEFDFLPGSFNILENSNFIFL